jgi:hypothetical protein
VRRLVLLGLVVVAALPARAAAQLPPLPPLPTPPPTPLTPAAPPAFEQAYGTNDGGGFRDVLPSGTRGLYNALELGAFIATGQTVPHCCEQLGMYGDLVYATPGLQAGAPRRGSTARTSIRPTSSATPATSGASTRSRSARSAARRSR